MYLNGACRPIAFVSRTLNGHETCHGQIDKEALAIMFETVSRVPRFHGSTVPHVYSVYSRHFTILTHQKPLERIFGQKTAIPSVAALRLQGWEVILAVFDYCIKFVPSKQTQWQTHYHAYLYRRRLAVRGLSSKFKSVW